MSSSHITRKRIQQECIICGTHFDAVLSEVKRGRASKTCGKQCYRISKGYDKDETIEKMLLSGATFASIRKSLNVSPATIARCARNIKVPKRGPQARSDWPEVVAFYNSGASYEDCTERFKVSCGALTAAAKRGLFVPRSKSLPLSAADHIQRVDGKRHGRASVRKKVLKESLIPYLCAVCGITEWRGVPLTLRLDHIDGDGGRHSLNNLRFLCPNCDSQQPTYGHRNRGRYKLVNGGVSQPA